MRRREFIALGVSAAVYPFVAVHAQQKAMPVIGFVGGFNPAASAEIELEQAAFRRGLREAGYVEGQNVAIEYRKGEGDVARLPALAAELVSRKVDVIVTQGGDAACFAAKNATATIPVVFHSASDPVAIGLVASLARPGGNLTGVAVLSIDLLPKALELLLEVLPHGHSIAVLVNPDNPEIQRILDALQSAARARRVDLHIVNARSERDLDHAFTTLGELRAEGLVVPSTTGFRPQIAALALQHRIPAIATPRDFADAGGLLSYGASLLDIYRLKGIYAGKILKGAEPADLPVQQPSKIELVVNLKTAKTLGLTVPQSFLLRANEVIE
jgi:putative ABC transport system substrate-binding protein